MTHRRAPAQDQGVEFQFDVPDSGQSTPMSIRLLTPPPSLLLRAEVGVVAEVDVDVDADRHVLHRVLHPKMNVNGIKKKKRRRQASFSLATFFRPNPGSRASCAAPCPVQTSRSTVLETSLSEEKGGSRWAGGRMLNDGQRVSTSVGLRLRPVHVWDDRKRRA